MKYLQVSLFFFLVQPYLFLWIIVTYHMQLDLCEARNCSVPSLSTLITVSTWVLDILHPGCVWLLMRHNWFVKSKCHYSLFFAISSWWASAECWLRVLKSMSLWLVNFEHHWSTSLLDIQCYLIMTMNYPSICIFDYEYFSHTFLILLKILNNRLWVQSGISSTSVLHHQNPHTNVRTLLKVTKVK